MIDELPENMKITITEVKENELNLTLPLKPERLPSELSEEELQQVVGGLTPHNLDSHRFPF